jgi:membrane-bound lytic murein transglycosylase D
LQAGNKSKKKTSQIICQNAVKPTFLAVAVAMVSACGSSPMQPGASQSQLPGESINTANTLPPEPTPLAKTPIDIAALRAMPAEPLQCQPEDSLALSWTPAQHNDVWARLRAGFQLDHDSNQPRVKAELKWFATHQSYIDRVVERASPYLYYVVEELERNNIPTELALLPIVESSYDPFAYSHGQAAGIWQFIPNTGKMYGLKQNWWYDGRRDIRASTRAAIQYLSELNKRYKGDWELTMAAYNAGLGNVDRAIRRNRKQGKPTDFWSLQLPKETRAYVPRLLAVAKIVANPAEYNVHLNPVPNQPFFHPVAIGGQLNLSDAARLAQVSLEELYRLNPGFNRSATDPKGPFDLLLPAERADAFSLKLEQLVKTGGTGWGQYKVKSGDNLGAIAMRHSTTVNAIKQANQLSSNTIRPGQQLMIPESSPAADYSATGSAAAGVAAKQGGPGGKSGRKRIEYRVRAGDSMWKIAQQHGVSITDLARWNNLSAKATIHPGTQLALWADNIPEPASQSSAKLPEQVRKVGYTVRSGDSLARIASRFNVNLNDILKWNPLDRPEYLRPGQSLTLYIDVTKVN